MRIGLAALVVPIVYALAATWVALTVDADVAQPSCGSTGGQRTGHFSVMSEPTLSPGTSYAGIIDVFGVPAGNLLARGQSEQLLVVHPAAYSVAPVVTEESERPFLKLTDVEAVLSQFPRPLRDELRQDFEAARRLAAAPTGIPLTRPADDAAALQVALWSLADGLASSTLNEISSDRVRNRIAVLLTGASAGALPLDAGGPAVLTAEAFSRGHIHELKVMVVGAGVGTRTLGRGLGGQRLRVEFPGGSVWGRTDSEGQACFAVPRTTRSQSTARITWPRVIPAGALYAGPGHMRTGLKAQYDHRRFVPDRDYVVLTRTPNTYTRSVDIVLDSDA